MLQVFFCNTCFETILCQVFMSVINRGQADSGQVSGNANPGGDNGMEYVDDIHRGTRRKVRGTFYSEPLSKKTFF